MAGSDGNPLHAARDYTIPSIKGSADALTQKIPKKDIRSSWVSASKNPIEAKFAELPAAKLRGRSLSTGPPALFVDHTQQFIV